MDSSSPILWFAVVLGALAIFVTGSAIVRARRSRRSSASSTVDSVDVGRRLEPYVESASAPIGLTPKPVPPAALEVRQSSVQSAETTPQEVVPEGEAAESAAADTEAPGPEAVVTASTGHERLRLSAPVELWVEDSLVEFEHGSTMHTGLRKYADELLSDLKAARDLSR